MSKTADIEITKKKWPRPSGERYHPGDDRAFMHELGRNDRAVGKQPAEGAGGGEHEEEYREEKDPAMAVQSFVAMPVSASDNMLTAMGRANTDAQTAVAR